MVSDSQNQTKIPMEVTETHAERKRAMDRRYKQESRARKRVSKEDEVSGVNDFVDQRVTSEIARKMAMQTLQNISFYNLNAQRSILKKYVVHPALKHIMPTFVTDWKTQRVNATVVDNIRESMETTRKDRKQVGVVCSLAASSRTESGRMTAKQLGLPRRDIYTGIARRMHIQATGDSLWTCMERKRRSDKVGEEVRAIVEHWWTSETTVSPNKKDVTRKRIGIKEYVVHPTHYLQESQLDFYTRFRRAQGNLIIGFRAFGLLKPWYIKRLKDRNTCACKYHVELNELKAGHNNMRSAGKGIHGESCECICEVCRPAEHADNNGRLCRAGKSQLSGITELWESAVCPKGEFSEWHNKQCLLGECSACGVSNMEFCPRELEDGSDSLVSWKCYQKIIHGKTRCGKDAKVLRLQYKETSARDYLAYLAPRLQKFIEHNFVARWQDKEFKQCLLNFPRDSVLSVIDFAENYAFEDANEIQEMHWHSFQISILVHITYRWVLDPNLSAQDPILVKEYHYYVSDDRQHDTLFVQHAFKLHWAHLQRDGVYPTEHIVWSDGCAGQFKSARCWYAVARYQKQTLSERLPKGCRMVWSFFGSGHGKGEHDGAGACVKREIRKEQLKPDGLKLQNANDVVQFLRNTMDREHLAYLGARRSVKRFFYEIEIGEIDRSHLYECDRVGGSRAMHSVASVSHVDTCMLLVRDLACFCPPCMDDDDDNCEHKSHVNQWGLLKLKPKNLSAVRRTALEDEAANEVEFGEDGETLASRVEVGDNFAVPALEDTSGDEFYLVLCDKPVFCCPETFDDGWGNTFTCGEMLLRGVWYHRRSTRNGKGNSYVLLTEAPPAYVYSHLVCTAKFLMPPTVRRISGGVATYTLSSETKAQILAEIDANELQGLDSD